MPKKHILFLFLIIIGTFHPVCGQDMAFRDTLDVLSHDWQEQILQLIDIENLGETAYDELLDELSELVVWSDTATSSLLAPGRIRQRLTLSSNRCLNLRQGYASQDAAQQAASKAYLGDPWHHSLRYRLQAGRHWQAGLTLEKDAGEAWRSRFPLYDSWHAFVRLRDVHLTEAIRLTDAVIGHYRLRMGCGLLINQGFTLGKQFMSQQLGLRTNVIAPHASVSEAGYMQGMAAELRLGQRFTLLPYFSARQVDGTLTDGHILTALQTAGYHRTTTEDAHRNAAWQFISGARVGWRGEWYDIGLHGTYTQLQYDYRRQALYYNANYFRGHELAQAAIDYHVRALGGVLRGECAMDDKGALASISTLQYPLGDYWHAMLLHRYYAPQYRQLHASSVSESSGMQGEQGLMLQVEGPLSRHWQWQGMFDAFSFSSPQYGIRQSSSRGFEGATRLAYASSSAWLGPSASLGYRIKMKGDYFRHSLDGILTLKPARTVTCRTQARARIYSEKGSNPTYGYAVSQSLGWAFHQGAWFTANIDGQACYFRTDDYDSRVYLTEKAILYGFGLPMLYGEGLRYSLTGTLAVGRHLDLDLKWALTNYAQRSSIGTGLQLIAGNTQQDLWLQLRLKI